MYYLRTDRLGFREWTADDFPLAQALWGDAETTKQIGGPFSDEQIRERLSTEIANGQSHGVKYWPVFRLDDDAHVGCCGLRPYAGAEAPFEFGVHLHRAFWRQGYAVEASRAVIDHAFGTMRVTALFAGHNPANHASRRLLQRLGFEFLRGELYPPTGLLHPSYLLRCRS